MAMYVYHADGHPVGFLYSTFIHDLEGRPLGRVLGSHVYRLDGVYVGEFFKQTVVEKEVMPPPRDVAAIRAPAWQQSPGATFSRRGVVRYPYPDRFHRLYGEAVQDEDILELAIAAE